jgi:hypothetical protein
LQALVDASLFGGLTRLHGDGGTLAGAPLQFLAALKPVIPLVAGAGLCWAERRHIALSAHRLRRDVMWGWLGITALGAIVMRVAYPAYALPLLAPLCLATGFLLAAAGEQGKAWRTLSILVLPAVLTYPIFARGLFPDDGFEDRTPTRIAAYLNRIAPGKPIYIVDYEPVIYQLTGAPVPTRFPFTQHLVCDFPAAPVQAEEEMRRIVLTRPAAILVSTSRHRIACEMPQRVGMAMRLATDIGYRRDSSFASPYGPIELWRLPDHAN